MRTTHYISIAAAIALIIFLYLGVKTTPPHGSQPVADMQRPSAGATTQAPETVKAASSFDSILTASRMLLSKAVADTVNTIETELSAIRDSSRMADVFYRLAKVWQRADMQPVAAWYGAKAAKLEKSEKNLTFAGQFYLQLMENERSPSVQMWEAKEAVGCLEQSLKINPDNEDTKLALATGYMEGTGEPMRGVQILLGIVKDKPDDIPANLLLGKMSVQSRQYDKAVGRFETVLKQEPENKEALYFLAQTYAGKGDKAKAVELLEKCKKLVNDPAFTNDVDQQINSLK